MRDILHQITEELAAGEFTVEGSWKGPESLKETALGVIRDRLMECRKTTSDIPEQYPSPSIPFTGIMGNREEFQSVCRLLRKSGQYRRPPMTASPYCSTGYLTADRGPMVYVIPLGSGKTSLRKRSPTEFDPADVVDYPNQLIKKMLTEEERKNMVDLYKRVRERTKLS